MILRLVPSEEALTVGIVACGTLRVVAGAGSMEEIAEGDMLAQNCCSEGKWCSM